MYKIAMPLWYDGQQNITRVYIVQWEREALAMTLPLLDILVAAPMLVISLILLEGQL
jgi:hypothetical protein